MRRVILLEQIRDRVPSVSEGDSMKTQKSVRSKRAKFRRSKKRAVQPKDCWICHRDLRPPRDALVPDRPIKQVCENHKGEGGRLEWHPSSQYSDLSIVERCRECKRLGTVCPVCYLKLEEKISQFMALEMDLRRMLNRSLKSARSWHFYAEADAKREAELREGCRK